MEMHWNKLQIWQKSMIIAREIYVLTQSFPAQELYGLVAQMRRCAVSIPSNIAEGSQRRSLKDFAHFVAIAKGSAAELDTQLQLACDLQYISQEQKQKSADSLEELHRMLYAFHKKLFSPALETRYS